MLDDLPVADEVEGFDDRSWRVEHRYRAVLEVLEGVPVAQVARLYGASRQSVHNWLRRFQAEGVDGLVERSRRPKTSPTRLPAEVEALICELRRGLEPFRPRSPGAAHMGSIPWPPSRGAGIRVRGASAAGPADDPASSPGYMDGRTVCGLGC